jgi:uncharacterized membrane protein YeaQ/YmgE (transglycosylase-associated protein family)
MAFVRVGLAQHEGRREGVAMLGNIIGSIIGGAILGYIGKLLLPGRQAIPWWSTVGAGIVAALLGTWVARGLGVADTRGIDWWEHIIQIGFAVIAIWAVARLFAHRHTGTGSRTTNY